MSLTCLPRCVSQCLRVLGPCVHHRHHLVFSWLLVLHLVYLVADSTLKGKRGPKYPVAQKTRLSQHHPDVFGFRMVILMAPWDTYRIPVDVALVRRTADPADETEHALFRHMLQAFRRPAWAKRWWSPPMRPPPPELI